MRFTKFIPLMIVCFLVAVVVGFAQEAEPILTITIPSNASGNIRSEANTQGNPVGNLSGFRDQSIDVWLIEEGENVQGERLWIAFTPSDSEASQDLMWVSLMLLPSFQEDIRREYNEQLTYEMAEQRRIATYNGLPSEVREMVDSGVAWFDYERGTFARIHPEEPDTYQYWAGGMEIRNDLPAGYWVEEVERMTYSSTNTTLIIRMSVEQMSGLPNGVGYYDVNLVNANGADFERWLRSSYGQPLRDYTVTIDLLAEVPRGIAAQSIITNLQVSSLGSSGQVIVALNIARTLPNNIRVKAYCPPLATLLPDAYNSIIENYEFADEEWISGCIGGSVMLSANMVRTNADVLLGRSMDEAWGRWNSNVYGRELLFGPNSNNLIPPDQEGRIVDIVRH